jgi:hypothetical protein
MVGFHWQVVYVTVVVTTFANERGPECRALVPVEVLGCLELATAYADLPPFVADWKPLFWPSTRDGNALFYAAKFHEQIRRRTFLESNRSSKKLDFSIQFP